MISKSVGHKTEVQTYMLVCSEMIQEEETCVFGSLSQAEAEIRLEKNIQDSLTLLFKI